MRKDRKILRKVCAVLLSLVVILPLLLALLLQIPAVQQVTVRKLARALSAKLETTVDVRRFALVFPGKVRVEGLYVEDYGRDTLLYAGRLEGFVTGFGLFGGGVRLQRARLSDAKLYLREMPDSVMNIKQVINRISNPDRQRKGNFRLSIGNASIDGMTIAIERLAHRNPPYGIDYGNMRLTGIRARVDEFTMTGPVIETTIHTFRAAEQSGFVLEHLSGRFRLMAGEIRFADALLSTAGSYLSMPLLSLKGRDWSTYKYFTDSVAIDGSLRNSQITSADVAYFAPSLRDKPITLSQIDFDFAGRVADFRSRIANLNIGPHTTLIGEVGAEGLPDLPHTRFDIRIERFSGRTAELGQLVRQVTHRQLPANLNNLLHQAGYLQLQGRFQGTPSRYDLRLNSRTGIGRLDGSLAIRPARQGARALHGEANLREVRLGKLLDNPERFGNATVTASVDGTIRRDQTDARVTGEVSQLQFNHYDYDSLRFDGHLLNRKFDGVITSRNPSLDFDFTGAIDLNDSIPDYDFSLWLRHADLVRLHINRRDTLSQLAGNFVARASGRSIDEMNGTVRVENARYRYNDKQLTTKKLAIRGVNSANSKYIELRSDFADATFRSRTPYREALGYLRKSLRDYLPELDRNRRDEAAASQAERPADGYSLLTVDIRDFNPVADAVSPGLQIAEGASLNLSFNPANDRLTLRALADYVERKRFLVTRLNLNARNSDDSLEMWAEAEDLYVNGLHLPGFTVSGGAKGGEAELSTGFADSLHHFSGRIGLRAGVSDQVGPNGRTVDVRILPSYISRNQSQWRITARNIQIDTAQVVIDRFAVSSNGQRLRLNGIASRRPTDTLSLQLTNFNLAPFSQIIDRMGYGIEGRTNGQALMTAVLGGGKFTADIRLDSLSVNGLSAPPMQLTTRWDFARNRAGLFVADRETRDTLIRGYYAPDKRRYYAHLQVDSLDMGLLDPVLSGVISSTQGKAAVDLLLQGERREAELTGRIDISDMQTTVDFTRVTYTVPKASFTVNGNRFTARNVGIFDPEQNRGRLDMELNLQHLSNIGYDVQVRPHNMLVLDTDDRDNEMFYGKVYASGNVRVTGDKGKVDMRINASTDGPSSFHLPMSNRSDVSQATFLTFEKPLLTDTTDVIVRKKQLFERRRTQRSTNSRMNINMTLDVQPNVDLELSVAGNTIRARGTGTLTMQIEPQTNLFEIYGDYSLQEGTFLFSLQNLLRRKFEIVPGSTIQWTGSPINAMLDIDAIYRLKASLQPLLSGSSDRVSGDRSVNVECKIHLGNRLTDPDVSFDIEVPGADPESQALISNTLNTPETRDMQFLYLLLFKSFMSENTASAQNIGASVSYGTGIGLITNQLSNLLSTSGYDVILRYRPRSELTSDELDFGLSKALINNRLFVELEGNYLIDPKQQASHRTLSNFMGEAYITYLIDRAGALKLKAFTQTIDRFDENQGLQETGIGIYFKEDFDNFRDLCRRVKERFTNKKRQARRAERNRERDERKAAERAEQEARKQARAQEKARKQAAEPLVYPEEDVLDESIE